MTFRAIILIILLGTFSLKAAIKNSTGGNWSSATNWIPVGLPGSSDTVVISGSVTCNFDAASATVAQLQVDAGATFNLVSGALNIAAGDLKVKGNLVNAGNCSLSFSGCAADQKLESDFPLTFYSLILNKCTSRLLVNNQIRITQSLILNSGICSISHTIIMSGGSSIVGSAFDQNKMIELSGDPYEMNRGVFIREETLALLNLIKTFPLGAKGAYTPFTVTSLSGLGILGTAQFAIKPIVYPSCPGGLVKRSVATWTQNITTITLYGFSYQIPASEICLNAAGTIYRDASSQGSGIQNLGANPASYGITGLNAVNGVWRIMQNLKPFIGTLRNEGDVDANTFCVGDSLTILGSDFSGVTQVTIGAVNVSGAAIRIINSGKLKIKIPTTATSGLISVTSSAGTGNTISCTINRIPSVTSNPLDVVVCENTLTSFSSGATDAAAIQWYRNAIALTDGGEYAGTNSNNLSINPVGMNLNGNIFKVEYSNACGSVFSDSATLTIIASTLGGTVGNDTTVCTDANYGTIAVSGNIGSVLNWQSSSDPGFSSFSDIVSTSSSISFLDLNQDTWYRAVVKNGSCATEYSTAVKVNVIDVTANAGSDRVLCADTSSIELSGISTEATSVLWSASGSGNIASSLSSNTSYLIAPSDRILGQVRFYFNASNSGCSYTDTMIVELQSLPTVSAGADQTICYAAGQTSVSATVLNAGGVMWSTSNGDGVFGATTNPFTDYTFGIVDEISSTVYLIVKSTSNGVCKAAVDTCILQLKAGSNVLPSGTNQVCAGTSSSVSLSAIDPGSFSWIASTLTGNPSGFSSGTGLVINDLLTGNGKVRYAIVHTNTIGCQGAMEYFDVTVLPAPTVSLSLDNTADTICTGAPASLSILSSENGIVYQPYLGGVALGNSLVGNGNDLSFIFPFSDFEVGINTLEIQATNVSCNSVVVLNSRKNIYASGLANQTAMQTGVDSLLCTSGVVELSVPFENGHSYQWYYGEALIVGQTNNQLNVLVPGTYKVQIKDSLKCSSFSTQLIVDYGKAAPTIQIERRGVDQSELSCTVEAAIQWWVVTEDGSKKIQNETGNSLTVYYDGEYFAVADFGGCKIPSSKISLANMTAGSLERVMIVVDNESIELPMPEDYVESDLFLYPNPSAGNFSVQYKKTSTEVAEFELYNQQGKLVYVQEIGGSGIMTDVSAAGLTSGLYQIIIREGTRKVHSTIVIE